MRFFELTESVDYMRGHCHVMALAYKMLHPDWQLKAHIGWEEEAEDDADYRIDHVYVVSPDGSAYDCRGRFNNEQELIGPDETGGVETQVVDYTMDDLKADVNRGELKKFTRQDVQNAINFIKNIKENVSRRNFLKGMGAMAVASPLAARADEPDEEDIFWGTRKDYDEKPRRLYPNITVEKPNQYVPEAKIIIYDGLIFNPMIYKDFIKLKSLQTPDIETLQPNTIQGINEKLFLTQIGNYNYYATETLIRQFGQEYNTEMLVKRNYDIKQRMARGDWSYDKEIQKQPPKITPGQIQKPLYPWEKDTKRDI